MIYTVKGFSLINDEKVDVFLELLCFLHDSVNAYNLMSGSSASSKSRLYIWKFLVHVLLKPSLKDFEHYLASMWNKHNYVVVWAFFVIALLWIGMKTDLFQSCGHCWVFLICRHIDCSTFTASSSRIWNGSPGIPSSPLALFVVMLHKAHLITHYRMSGCRWVITPSQLSGLLRSFLYTSPVYSCHLFLMSSASVRSIPLLSFIVPVFAWKRGGFFHVLRGTISPPSFLNSVV